MRKNNPYLKEFRLQDVVGALQFLASYKLYKLTAEDWLRRMEYGPRSAQNWYDVFYDHPEFFRINDDREISLVWRKASESSEGTRLPLDQEQVETLINTAINFHSKAVDRVRDRRWWIPMAAAALAFLGALGGSAIRAFGS